MSFKKQIEGHSPKGGLIKFDSWQGDWDTYKEYLEKHMALSSNFQRDSGKLVLRDGYHPQWKLKDFL